MRRKPRLCCIYDCADQCHAGTRWCAHHNYLRDKARVEELRTTESAVASKRAVREQVRLMEARDPWYARDNR